MLKENVTVIFDRKKQVEKRGSVKVELRIYLGRTERKYISLGDFPAEKGEKFASSPQVKAERRKCEQIVGAMELPVSYTHLSGCARRSLGLDIA